MVLSLSTSFAHYTNDMSDEEEFFLTLPSTASATIFPNNITSNYRTKLAQRLDLSTGQWRVSLASIDLPNKFHNIKDGQISAKGIINGLNFDHSFTITSGWYKYPTSIVSEVNKHLSITKVVEGSNPVFLSDLLNVSYNSISGRTSIVATTEISLVSFSYDFQTTLGVDPSYPSGSHTGPRPADPSHGMAQLYVYCNVVKPWRVGDSMSQLLRTAPVHAIYGDVSHTFPRNQFVPVVSSNVDVIEIDIRWDSGESVTFEGGKVVATLLFKRIY